MPIISFYRSTIHNPRSIIHNPRTTKTYIGFFKGEIVVLVPWRWRGWSAYLAEKVKSEYVTDSSSHLAD
jgi:hypothetical protein